MDELGRMKDDCAAKGATIWMGFNKNVTAYVTKGREALAKVPGGDFTLVHHNAYKANELGECFERNAEGMLKNMARSRRPVVWRRLHAIDATRVHQTRSWVVSFLILSPFGPSRETPRSHRAAP